MLFEKMILNTYKGMMHTRCDDVETVFYFSADDFEGLNRESYAFYASTGCRLQGYVYAYSNPIPKKLVVFDHGFGGGHRAYMKEIEMLCRRGYTVIAYDHMGCMESEGESPNGMAQSLCDLNDCLNAIGADARFAGYEIFVVGHSWGGFSTLNISAIHPEVSRAVVISGFVSVEELVNSFFSGVMKGYRKVIMELERKANPVFVRYDATESLKKSNAKVLLVYSDNDPLCSHRHFDLLKAALDGKENIRFLLVHNKGHNPNYTEDAVGYLGTFSKARGKLLRRKNVTPAEKQAFVNSFDWNRMTAQDEAVWEEIFKALEA